MTEITFGVEKFLFNKCLIQLEAFAVYDTMDCFCARPLSGISLLNELESESVQKKVAIGSIREVHLIGVNHVS